MEAQRAGWYDDPDDPAKLRYFDGIIWTSNVVDKYPAALAETAPAPGLTPPANGPTGAPMHPNASLPRYPGSPPEGHSTSPYGGPQAGRPPHLHPGYGHAPGGRHPAPGFPQRWITPDGVPLASWWLRVAAALIDWFVCSLIAMPVFYRLIDPVQPQLLAWYNDMLAAASSGGTAPNLPADVLAALTSASLAFGVITIVYEVLMLVRSGRTVGRILTGTSVRLTQTPGAPSAGVAIRRTAVKHVQRLLGPIAVIGDMAAAFGLADSLWPLWDKQRRALHDKVAGTSVVIGKQPPPQDSRPTPRL